MASKIERAQKRGKKAPVLKALGILQACALEELIYLKGGDEERCRLPRVVCIISVKASEWDVISSDLT